MSKNPPNRRGITFEVGAQLEARDRLKKWYAALIEEINFEEGKVLIHFKHWNHRHDEWFCWHSPDLRPEEKIQLRKEGLHEEQVQPEFRVNQQVLACWSDCRFYPAKITAISKDGTYTVKFFDGIVQTVKSIHVKAFSKDQSNVTNVKPIERNKGEVNSRVEKQKFNEHRNATENVKKEKDVRSQAVDERQDSNKLDTISEKSSEEPDKGKLVAILEKSKNDPEKEKLVAFPEKSKKDTEKDTFVANSEKVKVSEIHLLKNVKEDKENISENGKESLLDKQIEEQKNENCHKARHESRSSRRKPSRPAASPTSDPVSQTLQPVILELRRRKISIAVEVHSKRPRLEKTLNIQSVHSSEIPAKPPHSVQNDEKCNSSTANSEKAPIPRRSSRRSSSGSQEMIHEVHLTPAPLLVTPLKEEASSPSEPQEHIPSVHSSEIPAKPPHSVQNDEKLNSSTDNSEKVQIPRRSSRRSSSGSQEMSHVVHLTPAPLVVTPLKEEASSPSEPQEHLPSNDSEKSTKPAHSNQSEEKLNISSDNSEKVEMPRGTSKLFSSSSQEMGEEVHIKPPPAVVGEPLKQEVSSPKKHPQESSLLCGHCPSLETHQQIKSENAPEIAAAEISSTAQDVKLESNDTLKHAEGKEVAALPATVHLKKTYEPLASKVLTSDLDHNKFKCKFKDCSKFFRKAKLLHYHMKYFHGVEKAEQGHRPITRSIQTRSSVANEKANREISKRRRTTSGSLHASLRLELRSSLSDDKTAKRNERRRNSVPCSHTWNTHRPLLREKSKDNQMNKPHRKLPEREKRNDTGTKDKEKYKEKKSKDLFRVKVKKKKKKKKKSKSEYSGSEENIEVSRELFSKKSLNSMKSSSVHKAPHYHESMPLPNTDPGHLKGQVKKNEDDTLSDSSADSLLWSDDEYSQEIDVTTNPEEAFDEDDRDFDVVRCMCEVQEENEFMIQCEECLCWQHGVCMGLLEDNVPEKYMCYICRDPPGQRSGMKYWYDKEWLSNGHMLGLSFLEENYSHQNAKKIVATHQLLGDVQRVIELLHGLQLKMSILQSKDHPDLKLWCLPWKPHAVEEKCYPRHSFHAENCFKDDTILYRTFNGAVEKPSSIPSVEESYITSEHCYQKPRAYYPAIEQRLVVETRGSAVDDGVNRIRENGDDAIAERLGWELDREKSMMESDSKHNYCKVRECVSKKSSSDEVIEIKLMDNNVDGVLNSQLQWQLNLLNHVESLQDEVTHRMDFIEKELDVLESFLDYTGELEPPEPLARLPQLKHRVKQLLTDLGKVQQTALHCSACI